MAFYETKVPNVLCFFFFLSCLFQLRCHLVKADQALIDNVCEKTGKNQLCHDCFQQSSTSLSEDIKGLAVRSIDCASTTAFNAWNNLSVLAARSSGEFKQACDTCVATLNVGFVYFGQAKTSVGAGDKVAATNSLSYALSTAVNCLNFFGSDPEPGLAKLQGFIDIAINVVNQIP